MPAFSIKGWMCVCVCACVQVCVRVHAYVCVHTHMSVHMCVLGRRRRGRWKLNYSVRKRGENEAPGRLQGQGTTVQGDRVFEGKEDRVDESLFSCYARYDKKKNFTSVP